MFAAAPFSFSSFSFFAASHLDCFLDVLFEDDDDDDEEVAAARGGGYAFTTASSKYTKFAPKYRNATISYCAS